MHGKSFYLMLFMVLLLALLAACTVSPQGPVTSNPTAAQPQATEAVAGPTVQSTEAAVVSTPTEEIRITQSEVVDACTNTSNPCECLGKSYVYAKELGELKEEYIGSWHAAPIVGSGYNERFVFFSTGNYLFFPSQYDCASDDATCIPSPIEEGIWGVLDDQMNLAKEGDIRNVRSILIGEVINSSPDESPYTYKTTFDGITYWQMSKDTNMWNPETGELCEGY